MRVILTMAVMMLAAGGARADPSVVTLSPAARAAALDAVADRDDALPLNGDSRKVHGEVGMEIGTGGHRALWGSATVPIGETGSATFAFLTARANGWRYR